MKFNKSNFRNLQLLCCFYIFLILVLAAGLIYFFLNKSSSPPLFSNKMVESKYHQLVSILGKPTYTEKCDSNNLKTATWMSPLHNFNDFGKFGGCDFIKIHGKPSKKYHPHPAIVFLIVGRYMKVPEHLLGPLKYASETINIEQLFVPDSYAQNYYETGEKEIALVTGSCASIAISAITVKFVEDMIEQFQDQYECLSLYDTFRGEYDRRIDDYLCGRGITDEIPWFDINFWGEPEIYHIGEEKCGSSNSILKKQNQSLEQSVGLKRVVNHFTENNNQQPG